MEPGTLPAHVASDPSVLAALDMRQMLVAVDVVAMDSWDFDVYNHTHDELAAHLCQMFMQQGLCQSRVSPLPALVTDPRPTGQQSMCRAVSQGLGRAASSTCVGSAVVTAC